ncbi:hypothetical protein NQ317_018778 [Molorchus minor]|uniref:Reverse transcriptase zinc-binding domain-containing protein n=1 Tax=Molorchus minor TaxID=1323400 RepID=A0ABQ9IVU5_9CUCU|nr:hypothetical protein NQ317_018778 [Molorchus minor]
MAHGFRDKALLRVISGYRTISASATQVVAEILPIDLLTKKGEGFTKEKTGVPPNSEKEERETSLERWQAQWTETTEVAQWTKVLIPDVYTHRIGKVAEERCAYCEHKDTVAHTMFECNRWEIDRQRVKNVEVGVLLNENNLIEEMIESIEKWTSIKKYIGRVMKLKEAEERDMQMIDIRRAQHLNP